MIVEKKDISGYLWTGAVVVLFAVMIALLVWRDANHFDQDTPGFPPGWHCTQYGEGASVCEHRPHIGAKEADRRSAESRNSN